MNAAEQCTDLNSIAEFLGFAPQHLFHLVQRPEKFYVSISIPKNSNTSSMRCLDIPTLELKGVQKMILKKILGELDVSEHVYSYVKGRSILTAANEFCPGNAILRMDIQRFFPSISFRRVYGLYKSFGFSESAAFILARLSTHRGHLAQGAPTSPKLSNLILKGMDRVMVNLSNKWELKYLRYSDDLFFYKDKNFNHPSLGALVSLILEYSGFEVNDVKTKYHPKGLPRITLGLLTHGEKPRIPGPQRKRYRSDFFKASRNIQWANENRAYLKGILEWHKCVNGKDQMYLQYQSVLQNIDRLQLHEAYQSI